MPKNSELMDFFIRAMVSAIGRRTSVNFSVVAIHTVIKKLEGKYDFLKWIEIDQRVYSEGIHAVHINEKIDAVEPGDFGEAFNDIIDSITYNLSFAKRLKEDPSYYFIKEIKERIESQFGVLDEEFGINLDLKQLEYLSFKLDAEKISEESVKNSSVAEVILKSMIKVLNKKVSELEAIKILKALTQKLKHTSDVLQYIVINDTPNSDGYYTMEIKLDIDTVPSLKIVETFELLLVEVGGLHFWNTIPNFLKEFYSVLGDEGVSVVKILGVRFDRIESALRHREHIELTKKMLETIVDLTSKKTSVRSALESVDLALKNVQLKYDVLKYITIDDARYGQGVDAIHVGAEINAVKSHELGKALWEVIRKIQEMNGDIHFIDDFKKELGAEYLQKIEQMGVNLSLLEIVR